MSYAAFLIPTGTAFGLGLLVGFNLTHPTKPAPQALTIAAQPRAAVDLDPAHPGTVIAPAITPGKPTPPPAPMPATFGDLAQTTEATAPDGSTFHASTFARLDGTALELRPVVWLQGPAGDLQPLRAATTSAPLRLPLPPRPTRAVGLLAALEQRPEGLRPTLGAWATHDLGPVRLLATLTPHTAQLGAGWSF